MSKGVLYEITVNNAEDGEEIETLKVVASSTADVLRYMVKYLSVKKLVEADIVITVTDDVAILEAK